MEPDKLEVSKLKKKIVMFLYENLNLKRCSCLVACSVQEAKYQQQINIKKPVLIIPNGVEDDFLNKSFSFEEKKKFLKKMKLDINSKILLFLSRVHPWKGLKLLLKVIKSLKNEFEKNHWFLVIAGPDEKNHVSELKKYIDKNNLNNIVKFTGPLFNNDKILMYDCSSCFILPSKGENFGVSIIEALARSKPVITTKNTPWKELIDYNCGWWIERTFNNLKMTILKVIQKDEIDLVSYGNNGKNLVREKYCWSKISNQYLKLYNSLNSKNNLKTSDSKIYIN